MKQVKHASLYCSACAQENRVADNENTSTYCLQYRESCFRCCDRSRLGFSPDSSTRGACISRPCEGRCRCACGHPVAYCRLGLGYRAAPAVPAMRRSGALAGLPRRLALPAVRSRRVPTGAAVGTEGKTAAGRRQEGKVTDGESRCAGARAGRYVGRLLFTAARRRWREVRALMREVRNE